MVDVEMAAHGVAVECHKKDIVELGWHQLEACIRFRTDYGFAVNKDVILKNDV